MFSSETPEQIILRQEKQIQELEIKLEGLSTQVEALYKEVGISPEKLDAALKKSENFSKEEWDEIQKQKLEIKTRLEKELSNLANPSDTAKTRHQQRELERHWIYVK